MKYVVGLIRNEARELELTCTIFPENQIHADVGQLYVKVEGAGFTQRNTEGKFWVRGRSESLDIDSRPEDADILNRLLT